MCCCFFSSRRRHTRCALVTGVQTCALPISLNAQASAIDFYLRHDFVPHGERFIEAGIEHQAMQRTLAGPTAIEDGDAAIATTTALVLARSDARRVGKEWFSTLRSRW